MPFVTEDEVKALLTPFHGQIRSVFHVARENVAAVESFRRDNGMSEFRYARTLADTIYDEMSTVVRNVFENEGDVRVIYEAQSFKVLFHPEGPQPILARFKKGDDEGRGQNHPTQTVLAFNDPEQCLPGFPEDAACIDITYRHDELVATIEAVLVVYRDGDRVLWSYAIDVAEAGLGDADGVLPFPPSGPRADGDDIVSLVSPKKASSDTKTPSGN